MDAGKQFQTAKKVKTCNNCLKQDHFISNCLSENNCLEFGCSKRHYIMLHKYFVAEKKEKEPPKKDQSTFQEETQISGLLKETVFLAKTPVKLIGLNLT